MRIVAVAAVLATLAVPATAEAAEYFKGDASAGARVITSGHTIQRLELYCSGPGTTDTSFSNDFAFSVREVVTLGSKGKFSYSGDAYRYGNEHQPSGIHKVKLSGRVSSTTARIDWSLPGCSKGTSVAPVQR